MYYEEKESKVKVFISWSGDLSLKVAQLFREWLPSVIQSIEPYVSSEDIDKGARWSTDIAKELENSTFGILCVTKENLEAPWLSFEAGALSKTMDKSFVSPFLFDIKRADVQGPILQFQSTVFEKDDIKKLVKTLNKACGDSGISEAQLDKTFDVWYPTLETGLNDIKQSVANDESENVVEDTEIQSSQILEEILDLSRDNQKLLRNPDSRIQEDLEEVKRSIDRLAIRSSEAMDRRRTSKKINSMMLEEVVHYGFSQSGKSYGFLMLLTLVKEELPWIYEMGREAFNVITSNKSIKEKRDVASDFKEMVDFSWGHPMMREAIFKYRDSVVFSKDIPYMLTRSIDDLLDQNLSKK